MEKLIRGRPYQIRDLTTGVKLFDSCATYVMPQEFKKEEVGIWETFFSELNDQCLYRLRIPRDKIVEITHDFILSNGKLVSWLVGKNPEEAYTPMVATWLREIQKIEAGIK